MRILTERRGEALAIAYSPDGTTLAAGRSTTQWANDTGVVTLWDVATGQKRNTALVKLPFAVGCLAFSPDGRHLAAGCGFRDEGEVVLADLENETTIQLREKPERSFDFAPFSLAFTPDGRSVLMAGFSKRVHVWNIAEQARQPGLPIRAPYVAGCYLYVYSLACSPDGQRIALGVSLHHEKRTSTNKSRWIKTGAIAMLGPGIGPRRVWLPAHGKSVGPVAFSPDGRWLASGGQDGTVKLWEPTEQQELVSVTAHPKGVQTLAFLPNGQLLSGGQDETIAVWDVPSGIQVGEYHWDVGPIHRLAVAPNGMTAAAVGRRRIVIWDLE